MLVIGRKHHLLSPERHLLFPEQGLFGVQRYCWTIRTETSPSQGDSCVAGIIPYATTEMEEACRWSRLTSPSVRHPIQLICSGLIGASFASAHCLAVFFLSASSLFTVALRASQFSQSNPQHAIKSFIFLNILFMQNYMEYLGFRHRIHRQNIKPSDCFSAHCNSPRWTNKHSEGDMATSTTSLPMPLKDCHEERPCMEHE